MKILALILAAVLLLGCTQTDGSQPDNNGTATLQLTPTPAPAKPTMDQYRAKASRLFDQPGKIAYRLRFEFISNQSEEEQAFIELFKALISGQESELAWNAGRTRLEQSIGIFGTTLNETTYVSINASVACVDDEPCEPVSQKAALEKIATAKKSLIDPYKGISLPAFLNAQQALLPAYKDTGQQAGRACARFELSVNQTYVNQTFTARAAAGQLNSLKEAKTQFFIRGIQKPIQVCLDEQTGYVASLRLEVDLSQAYSKEEVPYPIRMILIQEVTRFENKVQPEELELPASVTTSEDSVPPGVSTLPLGANLTASDGTRYAYIGKQNGSYVIDIQNTQNASCGVKQLRLPEWTEYECNGQVYLFLIWEEGSDEFELAVQLHTFQTQPYDPVNRPITILPQGLAVPFSDVPLIMQYDGQTEKGDLLYVGPWQGPCPTETFYVNEKSVTYTCEGQTYAIKKENAYSQPDAFAVQVVKTD